VPFSVFTILYFFLGAIVVWLLSRHVLGSPRIVEAEPEPPARSVA
jgi:uncharacterized membrane protein